MNRLSIDFLSHASKFKSNEDKMGIKLEIKLAQYKTLLRDMEDGIVMVPSKYCFGDEICLLDFIAN
jgi:hypothetical protein